MTEGMRVGGCWVRHVGGCATCGAQGVPVATMDYYTNCAGCLRRVADELEEKTKAKEETKMSCRHDLAITTCARCSEREDLRRRIQDVLRDICGLDVDLASLRWAGDAVVSFVVSYDDDLNFEKLSRISTAFRTRKIDLSCDSGTGSDPCHQKEIYVREPVLTGLLGDGPRS